MPIVVTTPTGNIGRPLTEKLLGLGEEVVLVARDRRKVEAFAAQGATVVEGSHGDPAILIRATKGADALFVLTPPDFGTRDIRAHYRRYAKAAASAIAANDVPYVVHLSSVGAELEEGTGPVVGLHVAEGILAGAARNLVQLRPAYFMENTLGQLPSILQAGALFTTFPAGTKVPMIATRDIGIRAAELLANRTWSGHNVVELHGSGETTYEDVARILSEVLGRNLEHVTVTAEQQHDALTEMGIRVKFSEPDNPKNTTATTYPVFAREVFKGVFEAVS